MTNEEKKNWDKALEISGKYNRTDQIVASGAAMQMAKWKDQQFNKVCKWLRETNIDGLCDSKNLASKFVKKLFELYNGS